MRKKENIFINLYAYNKKNNKIIFTFCIKKLILYKNYKFFDAINNYILLYILI
jgi:hypothetical protein